MRLVQELLKGYAPIANGAVNLDMSQVLVFPTRDPLISGIQT